MENIIHDLSVTKPDYHGGSIVNLMRAIGDARGASPDRSPYVPLPGIEERLRDAKRIVVLVIDGLGLELLRHIGRDTIFEQSLVRGLTSVYPPTTASAVTTYMTGLAPQQHGLTGWFMHFRRLGAVAAVLPFVPRFGSDSLCGSGVEVGALVDCPNFFDAIACPSLAVLPGPICDSDFSRHLGGRSRRVGYGSLEDFATTLTSLCTGHTDAGFVYAYWSELDRLCHMHGPSSEIIATHLRDLDKALAPVFAACADSGTVLLATADHGFIDSGSAERIDMDDHPQLQDMLSLPLCGEPRTAYCYVRASCGAAFTDYVENVLSEKARIVPSAQLIEEGWFGLGTPHDELLARIGDFTLQLKGRYTVSDRVAGERRHRMEGVHGGTSAAEMIVPLMIAGP
ncbi:MAG: hypothetical protein ACI8XZ_004907 [Gammaproteobacteria bacterium]|jgi:hypothetical protein